MHSGENKLLKELPKQENWPQSNKRLLLIRRNSKKMLERSEGNRRNISELKPKDVMPLKAEEPLENAKEEQEERPGDSGEREEELPRRERELPEKLRGLLEKPEERLEKLPKERPRKLREELKDVEEG